MAEPKFYTKNYVDGNASFTMSHGSNFTERLYDGDKNSQYQTSGANSDATQVTIEVEFQEAGVAISRTVDYVIMLNHNFDDYDIDYWDGSAWQDWNAVASGAGGGSDVISVSSQSIQKFRVRVSATSTANAEKAIGQMIACEEKLDIGVELTNYAITPRERANFLQLGDGSVHKTIIKHSQKRTDKYEASLTFRYMTEAQMEALLDFVNEGDSVLWQPESTQRIDEIFHVNFAGPLNRRYSSLNKGGGFDADIKVREV